MNKPCSEIAEEFHRERIASVKVLHGNDYLGEPIRRQRRSLGYSEKAKWYEIRLER